MMDIALLILDGAGLLVRMRACQTMTKVAVWAALLAPNETIQIRCTKIEEIFYFEGLDAQKRVREIAACLRGDDETDA